MIKQLLLLLTFILCVQMSYAQPGYGSTAPDFTLTDMNGTSHNLYDVLDSGKSVIIDFSATWCGPCWSYHNTGILENVYDTYGPDGTNQVEVYYVESDPSTTDPCIFGDNDCVGGTQGDWTAGANYHFFNPPNNSVPASYTISYYPTLVAVCPDRKVYEVGQASENTWANWITQSCLLDQSYLTTEENCFGDGQGSIDLTLTGGFGNVNVNWSNGATTEDLIGVPQGTYYANITDSYGRTISTGDIVISGPSQPVQITSQQIEDISCNGNADGIIEVSASSDEPIVSFNWNNGATGTTIENLTAGLYTVTATDANGCTSEATYEILEPEELMTSASEFSEHCDQQNGIIQISANGGSDPLTYIVNGQSQSSNKFENLSAGVYNVQVIDINGCSTEEVVIVEEIPAPEANIEDPEDLSCTNNEIVLVGSSNQNGSNIFYSWSTDDGNIVDGESESEATIDAPGTYVLEVIDILTNCVGSEEVTIVSSIEEPTAVVEGDTELDCSITEITLDGSGSSDGDEFSYLWTTEDGNIIEGETTTNPVVNAAGTYVLEVMNDENGCSSTAMIEITQAASLPTADAGEADDLTCSISEITLDGSGSSSEDNIAYIWTTEDGNIVSGENTINPLVDQAGTYLLEVINEDNGCSSFSSVVIGINDIPSEVLFENPSELTCLNAELDVIISNADNYESFLWTTDDGNILFGATTSTITVDEPGTYEVTAIDATNGCSTTHTIEVDQTLNNPVSAYSKIQDQFDVDFTAEAEGENLTYSWDFGDGNTSSEENPTHTYADNGTYEVCLTVSNECGDDTSCEEITISLGSPLDITIIKQNVSCFGECDGSFQILTQGEQSNYTVTITDENGNVISENFSDEVCAGTYFITIENEIGETQEFEFTIESPEELVVEESMIQINCFENNNGEISLDIEGGTGEYFIEWNTGEETPTITELPAGTYSVDIIDENDCLVSEEYEIIEPEEITQQDEIIEHVTTEQLGSIDINISGGTEPYTFEWSNGETSEDISELDPGEYFVDVIDNNGCHMEFGPFIVKDVTSTFDYSIINNLSIYPNPTNDLLIIDLELIESKNYEIQLISNVGQVIKSEKFNGKSNTLTWSLSEYSNGIYLIKTTIEGNSTYKKVVKQ